MSRRFQTSPDSAAESCPTRTRIFRRIANFLRPTSASPPAQQEAPKEISPAQTTETETHHFQAVSDQAFSSVSFHSLSDMDRARLRAAQILERHRAAGNFARFAHEKNKKEDFLEKKRAGCAPALLLFSMATFHGEIRDNLDGLFVSASSKTIAGSAGLTIRSGYTAIRILELCGAIRRMPRSGQPDAFEVVMPPQVSDPKLPWVARAIGDASLTGDSVMGKNCQNYGGTTGTGMQVSLHSDGDARAVGASSPIRDHLDGHRPADAVTSPAEGEVASLCDDSSSPARAFERHVHVLSNVNVHVHQRENVESMLLSISFAGRGFDRIGINKLLRMKTCTPERIAAAHKITASKLGTAKPPRDPLRYMYGLIRREEINPPFNQRTSQESIPEHQQEEVAARFETYQADESQMRRMRKELSKLSPSEVVDRARKLADAESTPFWRDYWSRWQCPVDFERAQMCVVHALATNCPISPAIAEKYRRLVSTTRRKGTQ